MQPTTPLPILIVVLSLICSLRRLRRANLTFGKLPLGKLHSWEGFNIIRLQTVCSLNSTQRTQEFTADYKQGSISLHTQISTLYEHRTVLYLLSQIRHCPLHGGLLDIPVIPFRIHIDSGEIENLQLQYIIVQKLYIYKSGILSQIYKWKN